MRTVSKLAQLKWTGHVISMPDEGLPKKVIYGEVQEGKRSQGGQKKRYTSYEFHIHVYESITPKTQQFRKIDFDSLKTEMPKNKFYTDNCKLVASSCL